MNDIAVSIKNLNKSFFIADNKKDTLRSLVVSLFNQGKSKPFHALKNIHLDIKKGEFIGIIGRNGSGKSTLLKVIAGIYSPDKGGEVTVNGRMVPFLELGVGFNPELSGRENIFLNGAILGLTTKEIKKRYNDIVEFSELGDFIHTPVKNYSSGMKVRLAFSIAIQTDADIYILDEILGVGDGAFRSKSIGVINKLIEQGKTVIYVSHSLGSVQKYCNRVVWLNQGEVIFDGDTRTGIDQYRQSLLEIEKLQKAEEEKYDRVDNDIVVSKVRAEIIKDYDLSIRAAIQNKKLVQNYNLKFSLTRDDDLLIYETTSNFSNISNLVECDSVYLTLKNLNLSEGDYYVDVAVLDENNDKVLFMDKRSTVFHIERSEVDNKDRGLLTLDKSWDIQKYISKN